jgi:hypothetical protein
MREGPWAAQHTFSRREKVPAKRADEGLPALEVLAQTYQQRSPSPVAFGDTLSRRERVATSGG